MAQMSTPPTMMCVCERERASERKRDKEVDSLVHRRKYTFKYKSVKIPLNNAVFLILHASRAKAISIRFGLEKTD